MTDVSLCDTSSYELDVQPFVPQDSIYSEGKTSSGLLSRLSQRLPPPVMQDSQDKVKCTWPGCLKFVRKDSRTRHVNEIHLRKVKTVCAGCGKGFPRSYMKKYHICSPIPSLRLQEDAYANPLKYSLRAPMFCYYEATWTHLLRLTIDTLLSLGHSLDKKSKETGTVIWTWPAVTLSHGR